MKLEKFEREPKGPCLDLRLTKKSQIPGIPGITQEPTGLSKSATMLDIDWPQPSPMKSSKNEVQTD